MDKPSVWRHVHQANNGGEGRVGGVGVGGGAGGNNAVAVAAAGAASSPACRPTGARWTPTPEQVKILKELYYGCGIRSPNAEQIQRIAARLRQFGRIEGKNVFYWFQNHKARERHKKRLAVDASPCAGAGADNLGALSPSTPASSGAAASSGGFYGACNGGRGGSVMQMDGSTTTTCWGDSAAATERSFVQLQDYMGVRSAGSGTHGGAGTAISPWPACYPFPFSADQTTLPPPTTREPETLPLFPTGGGRQSVDDIVHHNSYPQPTAVQSSFQRWGANTTMTTVHQLQDQQQYYSFYSNQQPMMMTMPGHNQDAAGTTTSLELTLSSYCSPYPAGSM